MHLEADGSGAGLTLTLTGCRFAKIREIFFADALERQMLIDLGSAAGIHVNLEVHLGLAVKTFQVALKLTLIGANGFAKALIVLKYGSESERQDGGMFEAIGDYPCVIDPGLLIEGFFWVLFADYDGEVTGGVEEDLITTDSKYGFQWDGFAMAG